MAPNASSSFSNSSLCAKTQTLVFAHLCPEDSTKSSSSPIPIHFASRHPCFPCRPPSVSHTGSKTFQSFLVAPGHWFGCFRPQVTATPKPAVHENQVFLAKDGRGQLKASSYSPFAKNKGKGTIRGSTVPTRVPLFEVGLCYLACRILLPQPGLEPGAGRKHRAPSPNHLTTREFHTSPFHKG